MNKDLNQSRAEFEQFNPKPQNVWWSGERQHYIGVAGAGIKITQLYQARWEGWLSAQGYQQPTTIPPDLPEPPPPPYQRQWVQCKQCNQISYYEYLPHSLSNRIMTLPCGHSVGQRFDRSVKFISEYDAITLKDDP